MKAILQFDLNENEDRLGHLRAVKATDAYLVIYNMFEELRKDWKYSQDPEVVKHAERYRDILNMLVTQHSIDLDNELE